MSVAYRAELDSGIVIETTREEHAEALGQLQDLVFPTLAAEERFRAEHYRKHIEIFADGQFVALDGDRVVGMTSSIRLPFDFSHPGHTFAEVIQGGWLTSHDPEGPYLYGADVGTHPDYRRRGIARGLYRARHDTVRRLGLLGQVTVGMLSGYGAVRKKMSVEAYYRAILDGSVSDPTISAQLRVGFVPKGLVKNYVNDPVCDNSGVILFLPSETDV